MKNKAKDELEDGFILEEPSDTKIVADTYNRLVFLQINRISSKINEIGNIIATDRNAILSLYCVLRSMESIVSPFRKGKTKKIPINLNIKSFNVLTIDQRLDLFELLLNWFDEQVNVFSNAKGVLPPIAVRMYAGSGKIVEASSSEESKNDKP